MTIIMKISNCSKTRLCLKLLYHNYSLYFVTVLLNFEAIDLENASEWMKNEIHRKKPDETKKLAK